MTDLDVKTTTRFVGSAGKATKTEGTNMAVRRDALVALGGFDPAYAFYLDETDLNMRMAAQGATTAIVPDAIVHHGYAPSVRRNANRVPRDLTEIGASSAVFLRKHAVGISMDNAFDRLQQEQHHRLIDLMTNGYIGPWDVRRLLAGLNAGWQSGLQRAYGEKAAFKDTAFMPFVAAKPIGHRFLTGRFWQRRRLHNAALAAVASGTRVTVLRLSATAAYHKARFHPAGYWEQTGGQFGRSERSQPIFRFWRARDRAKAEELRVMVARGCE